MDASLFRCMAAMEDRASFADPEIAAMRATYDATLWDLDQATGDLIEALADRRLLDDTIVIITSDHGENIGENGMYDHRWDLHQTLIHVPLVVRYPARVPAQRISAPVSTGDLFGEIVALTALPPPDVAHPLPRLRERAQVFSEIVAPTHRLPEIRAAFEDLAPRRWRRRYRTVIDGPIKLLRASDGTDRLYDLAADPAEQTDLSATQPDKIAALRRALQRWDRTRPKYDPALRAPTDRPGNPMRVDPDVAAQLQVLGYADEAPTDETDP